MNAGRRAVAVAAVLTLALGACGAPDPTDATEDTSGLEVVSWWTSGSEAAALDTLLTSFRATNPQVEAVNAAVAGGAGSQAVVELAKRLQRDDPPDGWQTFIGEAVRGYAARGAVREVSSVFSAGDLDARLHPVIKESLRHDGKPYGVPTGAHRSNVLWFNTGLLTRAGVAVPSGTYPFDRFLDDLRRVEESGATPLCLGARDPFTGVELFENVLLGTIGAGGWADMADDRLDWRGDSVRTALNSFGELLAYADPQADGMTWDAATKKLTDGGCAFLSMNDSAYGELVANGAREGSDFQAVPFPGTGDNYLAVVDVFVAATEAKNAKNALAFLSGISDPATQLAFSRAKGSVPVVRDVRVSELPAYQQEASRSLWNSPVLLSVAHGEAMDPQFQEGFYDAVSTYVRTRDPDAFADSLEDAVSRDRMLPR